MILTHYTVAMFVRYRHWRPDHSLVLLLGLTLFALTPLAAPGYFYSAHDGRHSVFFVTMFDETFRGGALWPLWAMHHSQGYGYPTFLIQAPLAFYVAEFFILLGLGITNAVKAVWGVAFLLSAWGMYVLVRRWILTWPGIQRAGGAILPAQKHKAAQAGLVAGLLYVYAPYHLLDLYVRAALAETMLMAWVPWVFWAFDRLVAGATQPGWQGRLLVAAFSYAGLMLTHAFAMLAVTPLLVAFILFRIWVQWRHAPRAGGAGAHGWQCLLGLVGRTAAAGVAGVLLISIFLLPLLAEGSLLVQADWTRDSYSYARHWVHWGQFFSPFWGYGYSDDGIGANDGMAFQLGVMLVILAIVAFFLAFATVRRERRLPIFLLLASTALLYLMTPHAAWLWQALPLLQILQFPWRLLALVVFLLSALGGLTVWQLNRLAATGRRDNHDQAACMVISMLIIFASVGYVRPAALEPIEAWREDGRAVFQFEREHPDMLGYTTLVQERFTVTPMTSQYAAAQSAPEPFDSDRLERFGILAGDGVVASSYSRGQRFGGQVEMATPGVVQIRLYAFPGWQVYIDGQPVDYRISSPHALMEVDVPSGSHRIDVQMGSTPARTAGVVISGLTLVGLVGFWMFGRRRQSQGR